MMRGFRAAGVVPLGFLVAFELASLGKALLMRVERESTTIKEVFDGGLVALGQVRSARR